MNNKNEYDLYKIIKANYDINRNDMDMKDISGAVGKPTEHFKHFKELLLKDSYFKWDFCIEYFEKCNRAYHITYNNINFYILSVKAITKKARQHLYNSIYRVFLIKKLFDIKPTTQTFNYYMLMNPLKRKLPNKAEDRIGAANINGGFTFVNSNNIYIVRKEDYEKVILHELLHHHRDIHFEEWSHKNIKQIKNICGIADEQLLIPNEAIIETYAIILNVIFYSIEHNMSFAAFKKVLAEDRKQNIAIVKKILDKKGNNKWYEKTHAYCYIVLRAIFYIYFKEFAKIYRYNNDNDITSFILMYFPKVLRKAKEYGCGNGSGSSGSSGSNNKYIKQTIFNNF
jgi:hypothetical protein